MGLTAEQFEAAGKWVASRERLLLFSHERPDGDAIGCLVALTRLLNFAERSAEAFVFDDIGSRYSGITAHAPLALWTEQELSAVAERFDGIVLMDTCAFGQLIPVRCLLESGVFSVLVLDHHVTRDAIGDCSLIDESASSTCLILTQWADALGWEVDRKTAEALFCGLATDTGWFRFSNTDARTLRSAARLLQTGFSPDVLYENLYLSASSAKMRLLAAVLSEMEILVEGRLAVIAVSRKMLDDCAAGQDDTDGLVNEPMRIGSVDSSILLVEATEQLTRVSFRSKRLIDVSEVARGFGGGGHQRAAGARIPQDLRTARTRVVQEMCVRLGRIQK